MNFYMKCLCTSLLLVLFMSGPFQHKVIAEEKAAEEEKVEEKSESEEESFTLPKNVISLSKANTFPNTAEDYEVIEPSDMTKALLDEVDIKVENPDLIKALNESTINPSPLAIGYRANIYLGRWALNYASENTSIIWDYQLVNENELNNMGGNEVQELTYHQIEEKEVKGALTNKIDDPEAIKRMILIKSKEKTALPLSFSTVVGANTKLDNYYNVSKEQIGYLNGYVPAVNETGQVTFGEVYIQLKGSGIAIEIKNVTKQGIGAWIPIQDHISLSFQLK